jgi:hypothetical protein
MNKKVPDYLVDIHGKKRRITTKNPLVILHNNNSLGDNYQKGDIVYPIQLEKNKKS